MTEVSWQLLATRSDVPSAEALASRLAAAGVAVRVSSDASVLGQAAPCRILVERSQLVQANWVIARGDFTEQELAFLSTGEVTECSPDVP